MNRTILLATFASLALTAGAANANLLANGSFEDTTNFVNQGNDTMSVYGGDATTLTGWTITGPSSHAIAWIGPTNPFGATAENGSYFLDLTGYSNGAPFGGVSQSFGTTAGDEYQVTFYLGSSSTYGIQNGITASAAGQSQTFTSTNGGGDTNLWQLETFTFVASAPSTMLSLDGASGSAYIGLDNVVATDQGPSGAVPEPSTWAMLISGFLGLGVVGYRGSRKAAALSA